MKNLKITALFTVVTLFALSILITSCQQDSLLSTESNDLSIEDRDKGVGVNLFGPASIHYPKFRHNGQWFEFADKKSYDRGLKSLTAYANDPKNNTGEIIIGEVKDGDFSYDSNLALANFEMHYRHQSLRKKVELEEDKRLRSGEDPARFQSDLDDRGFTFDVKTSILNKDGVVKIGRDIFIAYDKTALI